ncbi:hypothetical protein EJB05_08742, partial [Eragrostis curvula]
MWRFTTAPLLNVPDCLLKSVRRLNSTDQHHEWYHTKKRWKSGYLSPILVSQSVINPKIDRKMKHKDKTAKELQEIQKKMTAKKRSEVASYVYDCFMKWQDKLVIVCPYNLSDHLICFLLIPTNGWCLVLDSAYTDPDSYKDIASVFNCAYENYVRDGGIGSPKRKKKIYYRNNFPWCYKQPIGSEHCGYYTCWFARSSSKYLDRVVELSEKEKEEIKKKRQQKRAPPSNTGSSQLIKYFNDTDDLAIFHRQLCLWCGSRQPYEPENYNNVVPLEELDEDLPPIDE